MKEIIGNFEYIEVSLKNGNSETENVLAKIDTGALSSSMGYLLAERLGCHKDILKLQNSFDEKKIFLLKQEGIVKKIKIVKNSEGKTKRIFVDVKLKIKNEFICSHVSLMDRSKMRHEFLIGRRDLKMFLVDPSLNLDLNTKNEILKNKKNK